MSAGATVDYAPLPQGYRCRRALRLTLSLCVVALLLLVFYCWFHYFWPSIQARRIKTYWEQQCLSHRAPVGTISYSNDPKDVQTFKASGLFTSGPGWRGKPYAMRQIPELEKLSGRSVLPAAFLHGRSSPSGPQRLVIIQMGRLHDDPYNRITLSPTNHQPLGSGGTTPSTPSGDLEICLNGDDLIRLYEGQPDPNDSSHFTIDYDLKGARGTIDGKLTASGDITLTPRSGRVVVSGRTGLWNPTGGPLPGSMNLSSTTAPTPAR